MRIFVYILFFSLALRAEEVYAYYDVYALKQSTLAMQSSGVVKEIFVKPSDVVKKGDILLELENNSEKIALELARSDYELALTELNNTKSKLLKFSEVKDVLDTQSFEDIQNAFDLARLKAQKAEQNVKKYEDTYHEKNDTYAAHPFRSWKKRCGFNL